MGSVLPVIASVNVQSRDCVAGLFSLRPTASGRFSFVGIVTVHVYYYYKRKVSVF